MRRWISFAFFGLIPLSGWAGDALPLTCTANVAVPPILRAEGFTEQTGDIVLSCRGGIPTPAKQLIPTASVTLTLNTQVTSRLINQNGQSEALLLIDEPGSTVNPGPISLCTTPGGCPVISNGTAQGNFNGTAGHPNAFAGIVSANAVTFENVPILAPVTSGVARIYRITNVRANVAALSAGGNQASIGQFNTPSVQASFIVFTWDHGQAYNINVVNGTSPSNPHGPLTVGFPTQGPSFQPGYNPTTVTTGQIPFTIYLGAQENGSNLWKAIGPDSTATDPFLVSPTTTIPAPTGFESGTVITNPFGGPPIGAADHGTVFGLSLIVPEGVSASIPAQLPLTSGANENAGTILWNATNAVQAGSNITVTAGPTGSIEFFGLVAQASVITTQKQFNLPIAMDGTFSQLPVNVQASLFYAPGLSATNTLAFSSQSSGIPNFNGTNLDGSQLLNINTIASVVSSTSAIDPLEYYLFVDGHAVPVKSIQLSSSSSQIALPPAMDISLVTAGAAISNISFTKDPSATWLNVILNQNTTPASASLSFNPTAKPSNYSTTLTFTAPNLSTPLQVPVEYTSSSAPWFTKWGFVNAASNVSNVVAPGEMFMILGHNFGPGTIAKSNPSSGKAQTTLAKTQVLFDGTPAALYSVQNTSTNSFVSGFAPFELAGKTTTNVKVVYNGVASPPVTLYVLDAVPGLFTVNSSGTGQGMILNSDNSVNSDSHRAPRGSVVTALATGGGLTSPLSHDGVITGSPAPKLNLDVKVYLDGALVPSSTRSESGNYDEIDTIKIRIPATARPNADLPVMIQIGDKVSQPGVTVAVK
ncbi:MAG TPA: hypothetical protein VK335_34415 [Bryobacteraceae bacterium]|nr:hypothetical protein [Bryobacteraceae bacterium]